MPGFVVSKFLPISVNASVSDAAAKTVNVRGSDVEVGATVGASVAATGATVGVGVTAVPQAVKNKLKNRVNDKKCFIILFLRIEDFDFDTAHPFQYSTNPNLRPFYRHRG